MYYTTSNDKLPSFNGCKQLCGNDLSSFLLVSVKILPVETPFTDV